ncbi:MAG: hypothetical protein ABFS16_12730 [Bacteroidota bacterium]
MAHQRAYRYKNIDMLMASQIITQSLSNQLADLSMVRSNWTPEYVTALQTRIVNAMETYLGLDKKKELRGATVLVTKLQAQALRELSFLKQQIEVDFSSQAANIFKSLGYNSHLKAAQQNDQEALIQLLFAFKKGMTAKLKDDIAAKGTNPALIDRITGYATQLSDADTTQESLKETTKQITQEAQTEFNEIYNELIGVCKIASNYYRFDPLLKAQFTFSRVVANMNASKPKSEEESTN